ncbi:MAG: sulfite exporter TauE/SafE family protein [Phycisphaerae bacterium]|nr:sulfite exporter TauE/SafE family protein [Phycisphaerae bacterium]
MSELQAILFPEFSSYLNGPALWASLAGLGLVVGVLTGLFGVGGGFLVVPLLYVLLGIPYPIAIGSSLSFIVGTSAAGLPKHIRAGNVDRKTALILAGGSMIGAVAGDYIQEVLIVCVAGGDEAYFSSIMSVLFIVLLLTTAWLVFRGRREHHSGKTPVQRLPLGPYVNLTGAGLDHVSLPGLLVVGLDVGVVTGLFGVGGGVLFVPILLLLVGLDAHKAVGTSLAVVMLAAVAGTLKKGFGYDVSLLISLCLLLGSSIGAQAGAWLCMKLHAQKLRRAFAAVVLAAAVLLAGKLFHQWLGS